jgi:predicted NBD/HSP70 family sugar kinase
MTDDAIPTLGGISKYILYRRFIKRYIISLSQKEIETCEFYLERQIPRLRKAVTQVSVTGGNVVGLKQMNKTAILRLLLRKSPLTKAEVASLAQLTFATVSNLITEMQSEGLVLEAGYAESNGGRKPVLYSVNPNAFSFIGIDLQVEKIVCVLTNFEGTLVHSDMMTYRVEEGPLNAVRSIRTLVQRVLETTNTPLDKVPAIGVSAPGPIDNATGVIISPPNMAGWRNVPLKDLLSTEFERPCYLEKDANAAALGESRFGAGKDVDDLVYIMVDVGIGGSIIVRNEIYRGFLNGAGEIGHTIMDVNGPACNCGSKGCLEAVASGLAIEREIRKELGAHATLFELLAKSTGQCPSLEQYLAQAGEYLGYAIANVCNTLNPPLVILGGGIVNASDVYFSRAQQVARQRMLPDFAQRVQIVRARLGHLSAAIGAAAMAFRDAVYPTL